LIGETVRTTFFAELDKSAASNFEGFTFTRAEEREAV
jgi:hypothetical protein